MTDVRVEAGAPLHWGRLIAPDWRAECLLGRSGMVPVSEKVEGDGATPQGAYPFRRVFYRADRMAAPTCALPVTATRPDDGWCDAPDHADYNRLITRPFAASHERLWRDDHVYDLILVIGHNDAPVVPGRGSAIFVHLWRPDRRPTEGCVALAEADMLRLLAAIQPGDQLVIV